MKAWISKYALTKGVFQIDARETQQSSMIADVTNGRSGIYYHREGRDWHRTEEMALAKAEAMRRARIASLKKQVRKLEDSRFLKAGADFTKYVLLDGSVLPKGGSR